MQPGTTLCIPAWNATGFLAETLAAVARQETPDLRILVSVDGNDMTTAAACRPFLADARFGVIVQPRRLGWVGNTNALIAAVETAFFAIMPHDDLPEPDWLDSLHAVLRAHPAAVCAYADLVMFGTRTGTLMQHEVLGPPLRRLLDTLLHQYRCVAYRGLVRRRGDEDRPFIPSGLPDDVAADTAWLMELAGRGELRREPRLLVRKRYHAGNTHGAWEGMALAARCAAAAALLLRMRQSALAACDGTVESRGLVHLAALLRLLGCGMRLTPPNGLVPLPDLFAAFQATLPPEEPSLSLPGAALVAQQPDAAALREVLASKRCCTLLRSAATQLDGTAGAALVAALREMAEKMNASPDIAELEERGA